MKAKNARLRRLATIAAVILTQLYSPVVFADDPPPSSEDVKALLKRIGELEEKVKVLERNREVDKDAAAEKSKTTRRPARSAKADAWASRR